MLDSCSRLETLVNHLVSLSKFSQRDFTNQQQPDNMTGLAIKAYLGLTKLCTPLHGPEAGAVSEVLRALIPSILIPPSPWRLLGPTV